MQENSLLKSLLWTAGVWLSHCAAVVVLLFVLRKAVPLHVNVFKDFSVQLPPATQLLIHCSRWLSAYWPLAVLGLLVDAAVLFGLSRLPTSLRWLAHLWSIGFLLGVILVLGVVAWAAALPMGKLANAP